MLEGIPVKFFQSLYHPSSVLAKATGAENHPQAYLNIGDFAVLHLASDFPVEEGEELLAHATRLTVPPDARQSVGIIVGCPYMEPPHANVEWPAYGVLGPHPPGVPVSFNVVNENQESHGWAWKGMSGGAVVVHDPQRGVPLSWHMGCFKVLPCLFCHCRLNVAPVHTGSTYEDAAFGECFTRGVLAGPGA